MLAILPKEVEEYIPAKFEIYAFSVLDNKIIFIAYDNEFSKISWYYFEGSNVYRINEF